MINDFMEIKDEKDRELYVSIRQIIDQFFLDTIEHHKSTDHKYHECFKDEYNKHKVIFLKRLKEESKKININLIPHIWAQENCDHMMNHIRSLMILKEYLEGEIQLEGSVH